MKEEVYTCDLCEKKRDRDNVYALNIDNDGVYVIATHDSSFFFSASKHICKHCARIVRETTR